ncbi:MAG: ATP-binding protein [Bacteroidota bacterium]
MEPRTINTNLAASLLAEAYACRTYDLKKSINLSAKALQLSKDLDDKQNVGYSLNQLSLFYMIRGAYKKAIKLSKEAIRHFEELGDEKGIADARYNIAGVYYKTDNYHLGLINLINCLNIYDKYDDYHNQARVHKSLGTIYEYFGDQKNAIRSYDSAIDAAKKINDLNLLSNAYNPLSGIYIKQNKVEKAFRLIERSIQLKKQTGDVRGLAFAIYGRAKVYAVKKKFDLAEADYLESISIHTDAGEKLGLGMAYHKLGLLYMQNGLLDQAKDILNKALEVSDRFNIVIIKFKSNYLLYQLAKLEGDTAKSLQYLELYLSQKEAVINTQSLQIIESYELINKMQILEAEAQLQQEKAVMTEKKDRAEQSARMKQDFLSTMSHEIRTPLNAVTTITSLLGDKYEGEDQMLITSLKAASRNLLMVINDILDFTKLDNGKVVLDSMSCDLCAVLQRIFNTYESLAIEKGISLKIRIDEECKGMYDLDETKLSQILGNLISNAIKYTEVGEVSIEVEQLNAGTGIDSIRFKVVDTGVGISPEYFGEMFESFSQPKSITTRKQGGTGLGLAIVKKLVEIYDSTIEFESELGRGSFFYFDLNLKKTAVEKVLTPIVQDQLKNKTVLLVEDNPINAMVAKRLLNNWGIITETAVNGVFGIEKANQKVFDFILMDIHMPEMNGLDATAHIRNNENPNRYTPIFALTADITAENQIEYSHYFNGFLRKPIEIDKLYAALTHGVTKDVA